MHDRFRVKVGRPVWQIRFENWGKFKSMCDDRTQILLVSAQTVDESHAIIATAFSLIQSVTVRSQPMSASQDPSKSSFVRPSN
jgi:hypothetical protein